jgi:hypothetical protein
VPILLMRKGNLSWYFTALGEDDLDAAFPLLTSVTILWASVPRAGSKQHSEYQYLSRTAIQR